MRTDHKIIEIRGLKKSFGEVVAVRDLHFSVREGELFAFLGVNGAGKSTTISILCGLLAKDEGEVRINGTDVGENNASVKRDLGVVFQSSVLDKALSVYDNLRNRAALYGLHGKAFEQRLHTLSDMLELAPLMKRTVGKLSGGQRRRIDIARALLHSPKLLILDEPTTGLDPQTRAAIWRVVHRLRVDEGVTVLLTTHYMEEAADADYVIILNAGSIAAEGTPLQLKNTYTGDFITLYGVREEEAAQLGAPMQKVGGAYRISVPDTAAATELIRKYPELFVDYEISKGKMDDVFLAVTGTELNGS